MEKEIKDFNGKPLERYDCVLVCGSEPLDTWSNEVHIYDGKVDDKGEYQVMDFTGKIKTFKHAKKYEKEFKCVDIDGSCILLGERVQVMDYDSNKEIALHETYEGIVCGEDGIWTLVLNTSNGDVMRESYFKKLQPDLTDFYWTNPTSSKQEHKEFVKYDSDKNMLDLIQPEFLEDLGRVLTFGAKKYSPDNWKLGGVDTIKKYEAAMLRHINDWRKGKGKIPDGETNMSHLIHAVCCIMFIEGLQRIHNIEKDSNHTLQPQQFIQD